MVNEQVRLAKPLQGKADSRVWVADQLDWKKQVVVKFFAPEPPTDDVDALVGLVEKVADAAQVELPHAVQTFEHALSDDGTPYVLMELLAGESLDARLKNGKLRVREAGEIVAQVAATLAKAHAAGISHFHLEPANIFLCKSSKGTDVKVLNFGLGGLRPAPRTWPYISPEQYLNRVVDHRTDLWSLGEIAYEMVSGRHPFDADKRRRLKWVFTAPSELWIAGLPEAVDQWFNRALAPKSEKRFQSALEMASAFAAFLPGMELALEGKEPAKAAVGEHKVIAVGEPSSRAAAPKPEPESWPDDDDAEIVVGDGDEEPVSIDVEE